VCELSYGLENMRFITIPLAALLFGQPSIRAIAPPVDVPQTPRSEQPPDALVPKGEKILVVIALIRPAIVPRPTPDAVPSYFGIVGVDDQGRPLDGSHRYRVHFSKAALPAADGRWSLTALENDPFRSDAAETGMLGHRDVLHYNRDRSLDVYLQPVPPSVRRGNWLRAPAGPFNLVAHVRWRSATGAKSDWKLPSVKRLD